MQYITHNEVVHLTYGGASQAVRLRVKGEGKQGVLIIDQETTIEYYAKTAKAAEGYAGEVRISKL